MNPNYTIFIVAVRAGLLVITAVSLVAYYMRSPKPVSTRGCLEQRMVRYLGVAVLLFNDPYYFVNLLWPNFISVVLSTAFVALFLLLLLLSWVHVLTKINNTARGLPTELTPCRIVVYGLIGSVYLGMLMGIGVVVVTTPTTRPQSSPTTAPSVPSS